MHRRREGWGKANLMEKQTPEQLREHYEIERELAARLRNAPRTERLPLYSALYDEMFRRVPHHSQLTRKVDPALKARFVRLQMRILRPYFPEGATFLEVGPGDCALAIEACKRAGAVVAVDVSAEITRQVSVPGNFRLALSDGLSIPVEPGCADLAYSTDMVEHLHPEDALDHLRNVHAALKPGGAYVCVTPNALCGPWDISRGFDRVPTGFHLKEYRVQELAALFRRAGFREIRIIAGAVGWYLALPLWPSLLLDKLVGLAPYGIRGAVARLLGPLGLKYIRMVARKRSSPA
jgi:SAM-dependent methyltransferase